jgi:hypothetical protein
MQYTDSSPTVHSNMAGSAYGQAMTKDCKANWQRMAFTDAISPLPLPPLTLPSGPYSTRTAPASLEARLPCLPPKSKVLGPSPSFELLHDSPHYLPCHLLCMGVVLTNSRRYLV